MSDIKLEALRSARYSYLMMPLTAFNIENILYITQLIKDR